MNTFSCIAKLSLTKAIAYKDCAEAARAGPVLSFSNVSAAVMSAGSSKGAAGQLAALLLLISPFFFWGTSMVAFKASKGSLILSTLTCDGIHSSRTAEVA